ncbi:MAG: hypothetical protein H0V70_08255 [Ktedonobacteraceae bacterium]|nr:hypothetical protein [Ktedonobacteraceae bacterium]
MNKLSTFQRNNISIGTDLAAEIRSFSPELRTFVVIGAYIQTSSGATNPSKSLNVEQRNLRFWIRKYDVLKEYVESDKYLTDKDLVNSIYVKDIYTIEQLENELEKYIQDFSFLEVAWKVDNPLP